VSGQLHAQAALPEGKEPSGNHWLGDWLGPRAGLDDVDKRDFLNYTYIVKMKLNKILKLHIQMVPGSILDPR
jgi:hypothetical protein